MSTPQETAEALRPVVEDIFQALRSGLAASQRIHGTEGWEPAADPHFALHAVRREVVERLKSVYKVTGEASDNLGSVMSGIVLAMPSSHVLRVWHTADGSLPPADTRHRKSFYHQLPSAHGDMPVLPGFLQEVGGEPSNLAILWDHHGTDVTRLDLVRPMGLDGKKPIEDWRVRLLDKFERVSDIDYGDGAGGQREVG